MTDSDLIEFARTEGVHRTRGGPAAPPHSTPDAPNNILSSIYSERRATPTPLRGGEGGTTQDRKSPNNMVAPCDSAQSNDSDALPEPPAPTEPQKVSAPAPLAVKLEHERNALERAQHRIDVRRWEVDVKARPPGWAEAKLLRDIERACKWPTPESETVAKALAAECARRRLHRLESTLLTLWSLVMDTDGILFATRGREIMELGDAWPGWGEGVDPWDAFEAQLARAPKKAAE